MIIEDVEQKSREKQELIEDIHTTYEIVYGKKLTKDLSDYEIYSLKDWLYKLTCKGLIMDERREYLEEHDLLDEEMDDDFL